MRPRYEAHVIHHDKPFRDRLSDLLIPSERVVRTYRSWREFNGSAPGSGPCLVFAENSEQDTSIYTWIEGVREARGAPVYFCIIADSHPDALIESSLARGANDLIAREWDSSTLVARLIAADFATSRLVERERERSKWSTETHELCALAEERQNLLMLNDRVATIGLMSAGIAHEINNPVTMISGNIQLLQKFQPLLRSALEAYRTGNAESGREVELLIEKLPGVLGGIRSGVGRISRIVRGLSAYVRREGAGFEQLNIRAIVEEAVEMTRAQLLNQKVALEMPAELPCCTGDPVRLGQVLVNLIVNASQALSGRSDGEVRIRSWADASSVRISVSDNGPGIPRELMDEIWTPFFTTKKVGTGTGLGLHICREIVHQHGGSVTVANRSSGGAEFSIELPIRR